MCMNATDTSKCFVNDCIITPLTLKTFVKKSIGTNAIDIEKYSVTKCDSFNASDTSKVRCQQM